MAEEVKTTNFLLQYKDINGFKNHGIFRSSEDAFNAIQDWWRLNKFKPPYVRVLGENNACQAIDYGSYSSFYYIIPINEDHFVEVMTNGIEAQGMFVNFEKYKYN